MRYERVSDFCYRCGFLGHNSQACNREIKESEENPGKPMYGAWITCMRHRNLKSRSRIGGEASSSNPPRDPSRKSWKDMMRGAAADHLEQGVGDRKPKRRSLSRTSPLGTGVHQRLLLLVYSQPTRWSIRTIPTPLTWTYPYR